MSRSVTSTMLAYRDCGPSHGLPVVFLHGLGLDGEMWRPTVEELGDRYRAILIDLPGHGRSRDAVSMDTIPSAADRVAATLDRLRVDRTVMIGLSMGGAVAQEFALRHPLRLNKLALLATMAQGIAAFGERARAAEQTGLSAQVGTTLARWFRPQDIEANDAKTVGYARDRLSACRLFDWVASWRALEKHNAEPRLKLIVSPTLIVAGTGDASTPPESMRPLAAAVPDSRFAVIDGAPHLFPLTHPRETAACLDSFVS